MKSILAFATAIAAVAAAPVSIEERQAGYDYHQSSVAWDAGATRDWRVHASCNASQAYQLRKALDEAVQLAQHAKEHALRWANQSDVYVKYFGHNPTHEVIGALDIVANGDKANALFRCDDPDGNCRNMPSWAGHWRGNNATDETVICPPSFFNRRYLSTLCAQGYNVRQSPRNTFWASDLLHRLYHMPAFGQLSVEHYAEGYDEIVAHAKRNNANSTRDSDGLQYFALEAYAYDIILPGVGCPGPAGPLSSSSSAAAGATTTSAAATTSTAAAGAATTSSRATTTSAAAGAATTSARTSTSAAAAASSALPDNCHTHADGAIHCV